MELKRLEIMGRGGALIGHIDLIVADPSKDEYKIVIQLDRGYQVLALRTEMFSGRISGILGKAVGPQVPIPPVVSG